MVLSRLSSHGVLSHDRRVHAQLRRSEDAAGEGYAGAIGGRTGGSRGGNEEERVAAQMALADVPLARFLEELLIPYEPDEVTRLIVDTHDARRLRRSAG